MYAKSSKHNRNSAPIVSRRPSEGWKDLPNPQKALLILEMFGGFMLDLKRLNTGRETHIESDPQMKNLQIIRYYLYTV